MITQETDEYLEGFSWAVPSAFAKPLAACRFEQGDMLYDTRRAYEGTWGEALPHINHSIQVESPMRGLATKSEKEEDSIFTDNWNMTVIFTLTDHKADEKKDVITTQGRLYSLLWKGDLTLIQADSVAPPIPTLAMQVLRDLQNAKDYITKNITKISQGDIIFLMPYDRTRQLFRSKFRNVKEKLSHLDPHISLFSPPQLGLKTDSEFAPTVNIACFALQNSSMRDVERDLKKALYTGSKQNKKKKEQFRINAHGHLFRK